jgi:hypothetical protein
MGYLVHRGFFLFGKVFQFKNRIIIIWFNDCIGQNMIKSKNFGKK